MNTPTTCNTCNRRPCDPFRDYDESGRIINGCVDAIHTDHLVPISASSRWHNRPEAKQIRAAAKKFLEVRRG